MRPRVTVWNEHRVEREVAVAAQHYPQGMHTALADGLAAHGLAADTALLDDPQQGLPPDRLDTLDVLVWWGHRAHDEVDDELAERIAARVRARVHHPGP